jgi:transcriptional regulator with XRE-family HTH domain
MYKPMTLNSAVAIELNAYLQESGVTRRELAEKTGMHYVTVGRLLLGQRDIDLRVVGLFADALGFQPRELIERAERRMNDKLAK